MICFLINPSNFRLLHRQQKTTSEHDAETIYTRNRWSSTDTDPCAVFPLLDDVAVSLVVIVYLSPTFSQLSFPFFSLLVHTQTQSMSYVGERSHKIDYRICTHKEQSPPNWSAQNIIFIFKKCFKHFGKKKTSCKKSNGREPFHWIFFYGIYILLGQSSGKHELMVFILCCVCAPLLDGYWGWSLSIHPLQHGDIKNPVCGRLVNRSWDRSPSFSKLISICIAIETTGVDP